MPENPPRILVVEDEFLVRDMIVQELAQAGFDVIDAGSAEEGLTMITPDTPLDLLFTDIRLPGMSGWKLAEAIRKLRPQVPVVYASGYAEQAAPVPRSKFLQKPYRPSEVLRAAAELGIKAPKTSSCP